MTKPLLFTPITIRDVTLKNRVVIAPMATYSAVDGIAQDFHFAHWGRLVLGGAACVFVEATAVTDQGRITNGDWACGRRRTSRRCERIAAFMKAQNVVPGIQIAHAGRKGSMQRPWFGNGPLTPGGPRARREDLGHRCAHRRADGGGPHRAEAALGRRSRHPQGRTGWTPPSARWRPASKSSRSTTRTAI